MASHSQILLVNNVCTHRSFQQCLKQLCVLTWLILGCEIFFLARKVKEQNEMKSTVKYESGIYFYKFYQYILFNSWGEKNMKAIFIKNNHFLSLDQLLSNVFILCLSLNILFFYHYTIIQDSAILWYKRKISILCKFYKP